MMEQYVEICIIFLQNYIFSSCFFLVEELEKCKSEYKKVKDELDATMQELNEMWDPQARQHVCYPSLVFS